MPPEYDIDFPYADYDRGVVDDIEERNTQSYVMANEPEPEEELK